MPSEQRLLKPGLLSLGNTLESPGAPYLCLGLTSRDLHVIGLGGKGFILCCRSKVSKSCSQTVGVPLKIPVSMLIHSMRVGGGGVFGEVISL